MIPTILQSDFKSLRQAYIEVKTFIEKQVGDEVLSLNTKIEDDLGCAGDDNWELLKKFVVKYNLDDTGFDYSKHFLSEGELFGSGSALLTLLTLPISLSIVVLKLLTFDFIDLTRVKLFPDYPRKTIDMTFGDMLTWYLAKRYCLRKDTKFKLTNAV